MTNLLSKFQNVFKNFIFLVIHNVKTKCKIRYANHFWAQHKEPLNKQNSLTCYYFTYLRLLDVIRRLFDVFFANFEQILHLVLVFLLLILSRQNAEWEDGSIILLGNGVLPR